MWSQAYFERMTMDPAPIESGAPGNVKEWNLFDRFVCLLAQEMDQMGIRHSLENTLMAWRIV
jgi:hypothetical protein